MVASHQFRPYSLDDRSDFFSDVLKDRLFDHVAMDRLQFGWHHQLAAYHTRLIGKALAIPSLDAASSFVAYGPAWFRADAWRKRPQQPLR